MSEVQRVLTADQLALLSPEYREEYNRADDFGKEILTQEILKQFASSSDKDDMKGLVIEHQADETALSPEDVPEEEVAVPLPERPVVMNDFERSLAEQAVAESGSDVPLYKNHKAQRALRKQLRDNLKEEMAQQLEDNTELTKLQKKELANRIAKSGSKAIVDNIIIGDRVEHTIVSETAAQKKELKRQLSKDDAKNLRLTVHERHFAGDNNSDLIGRIANGQSENVHIAAVDQVKDNSGDRHFEPHEVQRTASESSVELDKYARRELRRLGYKVSDDTWKNALGGAAIGLTSGAAVGALLGCSDVIVNAAAKASAGAYITDPGTGEILASVTKEAASSAGKTIGTMGQGAITGGVAGLVAGTLSAIAFGRTEDDDALHGTAVTDIFKDNPNTGHRAYEDFGFYNGKLSGRDNDIQNDKVKTILRAIDSIEDLTDAQKTQYLIEAAGPDGHQILSNKELMLAYVNAKNHVPLEHDPEIKPDEPVQVDPVIEDDDPVIEDDDPVIIEDPEPDNDPVTPEPKKEYGVDGHDGKKGFYVIESKDYPYAIVDAKYDLTNLPEGVTKSDVAHALMAFNFDVSVEESRRNGVSLKVGQKLTLPEELEVEGHIIKLRPDYESRTPKKYTQTSNTVKRYNLKLTEIGGKWWVTENGKKIGKEYPTRAQAEAEMNRLNQEQDKKAQ